MEHNDWLNLPNIKKELISTLMFQDLNENGSNYSWQLWLKGTLFVYQNNGGMPVKTHWRDLYDPNKNYSFDEVLDNSDKSIQDKLIHYIDVFK